MVMVPAGMGALLLAVLELLSKLASTVVQSLVEQTWKLTVPVSLGSGSLKVAVRVGVEVRAVCLRSG